MLSTIIQRLTEEDKQKTEWISSYLKGIGININPLVTNIFSKNYTYQKSPPTSFIYGFNKPTLFIPFGKYLGKNESEYSKATLSAALTSIPAQLIYDIFWATVYCLIAVPSLFAAASFAIHAGVTHNPQSQKIAETALGNIICAPYFVLAIVVDLSRELLALVTRTYATITESEEARKQDYWYKDNQQFSSNK